MGLTAGLRALGISALAAVSVATVAAPSVAAGASTSASSAAARVVQIAEQQRGKRYAYGATGPSAFDCSGLVLYAYRTAGVADRLGGRAGYAMLAWARAHHRFSASNPQIGDVVIYGGGAHAAIYIGQGRVISALNRSQGIQITGLHALRNPVTGYIHTGLGAALSHAAAPGVRARPGTASAGLSVRATHALGTVRTRGYAHLRASASTAAPVTATVSPGVRLRVTATTVRSGVRWDQVAYAGRTAWVRADLVRAG